MQELKSMLVDLGKQLQLNTQTNYNLLMSNIIVNANINDEDKQLLLLLLQARDRNYIRLNDNEQVYENIKTYLNLLRPLMLDDTLLIRIGGSNDGGYVMFNGGGCNFL